MTQQNSTTSKTVAQATLAEGHPRRGRQVVHRYLVTVKYSKVEFHSINKYMSLFNRLKESIPTGDFGEPRFELDSKKVLHMHFILVCETAPYFKKFKGYEKGCVIHFKPIREQDMQKVTAYLNKNVMKSGCSKEAAEYYQITSYCHFNNIFLAN